jgi:mannose-6-phosphate isomerase-like protein (cupin superfamily)
MKTAHIFRSSGIDWQPHPRLRGIRIKSLENSETYSEASVTLVQVDPGVVIGLHSHGEGHETAFVLSGQGVLGLPEGEVVLGPGDGVTVPPKTPHTLRNSGEEPMQILAIHIPPTM